MRRQVVATKLLSGLWPGSPFVQRDPPASSSCQRNVPKRRLLYEIHGGELVVVPSPLPRHQFAVQAVFLLLHEHARMSGGVALAAPLDVVFDEHDVLQPDVLFFRAERRHLIRPDAVTRHAPDVAVEVLFPSTAAADRGRKMRTFARYGVPECWLVDPALERIEIHVLDACACRLAQAASPGDTVRPVLPAGLTFDTARVFLVPQG